MPNCVSDLYKFKHQGHCNGGWDGGPNTNQDSIMDCRNECLSRTKFGSEIGYFAYKTGSNCACYLTNGGCPDDNKHNDHKAYFIVTPGIIFIVHLSCKSV